LLVIHDGLPYRDPGGLGVGDNGAIEAAARSGEVTEGGGWPTGSSPAARIDRARRHLI
jgi:hypothetical protein